MKMEGTITALITPFKNGQVDSEGLQQNIESQIAHGITALLVLGTTGEASTLTMEEQRQVIMQSLQIARGRIPIWVGTGSYCTRQTIEKTRQAQELGADVALVVTPYYNKPTQEGLFRHFEAIATQVDIPLCIYNIPGRASINIETETMLRIAALPNVIGVKEASGNINQAGDVLHAIRQQWPAFQLLCGDDALTLPMMALGAKGVISVVSNLVPDLVIAQVQAALNGQFDIALQMHQRLLPLYKAAFIETNPVPIKTAMQLCGMAAGDCRLPMYRLSEQNVLRLTQVLKNLQLLK